MIGHLGMTKFHVKHVFAICAALAFSAAFAPAAAQKMYRCAGAGGSTTFTDTPCASSQGNETVVKPASGAAKSPLSQGNAPTNSPTDPQASSATDKRLAEYEAALSPGCRRARLAYLTKVQQKEGIEELMKEGNPIARAWEACQAESQEATRKIVAKDRERTESEDRKRVEQDLIAQRKSECATKQKVLDERRPRLAQLSESDRAAFRVVEQDVAVRCR